jgi:hypothetical protein
MQSLLSQAHGRGSARPVITSRFDAMRYASEIAASQIAEEK